MAKLSDHRNVENLVHVLCTDLNFKKKKEFGSSQNIDFTDMNYKLYNECNAMMKCVRTAVKLPPRARII